MDHASFFNISGMETKDLAVNNVFGLDFSTLKKLADGRKSD